jgi:hypothetical protein
MRALAAVRRAIAIALLTVVGASQAVSADNSPRSPEYLIKAAYLYNFALFVEWPADAFLTADTPIVIGIIGTDPFGWALDKTVENKRISKRRIVVERLQPTEDLKRCHILFVSASEGGRLSEVTQRVQGLPILIVDDGVNGNRRGGAIDFVVDDNKVGFAINLDVVRRARLTISSKMLGLARTVR